MTFNPRNFIMITQENLQSLRKFYQTLNSKLEHKKMIWILLQESSLFFSKERLFLNEKFLIICFKIDLIKKFFKTETEFKFLNLTMKNLISRYKLHLKQFTLCSSLKKPLFFNWSRLNIPKLLRALQTFKTVTKSKHSTSDQLFKHGPTTQSNSSLLKQQWTILWRSTINTSSHEWTQALISSLTF